MQDTKQSWRRAGVVTIILVAVMVITVAVGMRIVPGDLSDYFASSTSSQITGVLVLGLLFSGMSGFQVGLTLFAYNQFKRTSILESVSSVG